MVNKSALSSILRKLHLLSAAEHLRFIVHQIKNRKANRSFKRKNPEIVFPPDYLIYETYKLDLKEYYYDGKETANEIIGLLQKHINLSIKGATILDWGCGPGRITRHLPALLPNATVFATDYNEVYVQWCGDNLKGINCSLNSLNPPTSYEDSFFDAIIGISIFTHLSLRNHIDWINELHRIIKPGGLAFITTQGVSYRPKLLAEEQLKFDKGELVTREDIKEGNRLFSAFQPPQFIKELITGKFEIIDFITPAIDNTTPAQDIWVFKKVL